MAFNEVERLPREEFEEKYWGRDLRKNLDELGVKDWSAFCDVNYAKQVGEVKKFDQVEKVLEQIEEKKAVITNTTEVCTMNILESHGLLKYFDAVVTSEQVERGKPYPDMILEACRRLGVKPDKVLVVGDSDEDVEAGRAAGAVTVGVGVEADFEIDGIAELPAVTEVIAEF